MPKGLWQRKVISLNTKIKILDRLRNGERVVSIAKEYGMNEATIRTIRRNENSIRKSVAAGNDTSMSTISYARNIVIQKMEYQLMKWITEQIEKHVPVDTNAITQKALELYEDIKNQQPSTSTPNEKKSTFAASRGWFERFKQRHCLHQLKLKCEQAREDANMLAKDDAAAFWTIDADATTVKFDDSFESYNDEENSVDSVPNEALNHDDSMNILIDSNDKINYENLTELTPTVILEGLELGRQLGNHFLQHDTNVLRALRFQKEITQCLAVYEQIYKDMSGHQKQPLITDFINKTQHSTIGTTSSHDAQQKKLISNEITNIPIKKKRSTKKYN